MPGAGTGELVLSPARYLGKRPQAPQALMPAQFARIDARPGGPLIARGESAGKPGADAAQGGGDGARHGERWFREQ